jgi:starvation-inducible DNA-binding protein
MSNSILAGRPEQGAVIQAFGTVGPSRLGLGEAVRAKSVAALNRLLAHAMALRDLYKKAHWQTSGAIFYSLHLLFDKHCGEQLEIIDALAERVQTLGGVALAHEAAERGDDGTNDLIVSTLARTNELQSWFLHEHLEVHDAR